VEDERCTVLAIGKITVEESAGGGAVWWCLTRMTGNRTQRAELLVDAQAQAHALGGCLDAADFRWRAREPAEAPLRTTSNRREHGECYQRDSEEGSPCTRASTRQRDSRGARS
jgi:hypothetical protein